MILDTKLLPILQAVVDFTPEGNAENETGEAGRPDQHRGRRSVQQGRDRRPGLRGL